MATNTASVSYTLENRDRTDTAHDTLAGLLAAVAVASSEVSTDTELFPATQNFRENATSAVTRNIRRSAEIGHVQVIARWRPYADSEIDGEAVAGESPPPEANVHAATFTVPSGLPTASEDALRVARKDGYSGVTHVLATALVAGWFPENKTTLSEETAGRYRRVAESYDTSVEGALSDDTARADWNLAQADRNLVRALAADIEPRLEARFETPNSAARAVSMGRVHITVRTWSR